MTIEMFIERPRSAVPPPDRRRAPALRDQREAATLARRASRSAWHAAHRRLTAVTSPAIRASRWTCGLKRRQGIRRGELRSRTLGARIDQSTRQVMVAQQPDSRPRQLPRAIARHQQRVDAVPKQLGYRPDRGRDHGATGPQRFECHPSERLVAGRVDDHGGGRVGILDPLFEPGEGDRPRGQGVTESSEGPRGTRGRPRVDAAHRRSPGARRESTSGSRGAREPGRPGPGCW